MIFRRKRTITVTWHFIEYRSGLPYAAQRTECWRFPPAILGRELGQFTVTENDSGLVGSGPFSECE